MHSVRKKYNNTAVFIEKMFPAAGELQLCCIAPKTNRTTGIFVAQSGAMKAFVEEKFHAFKRNNYYITKNTFKSRDRTIESLYSFSNIVIDIDDHRQFSKNIIADEVQMLINEIGSAVHGESLCASIPEPSLIITTGRGVQIWYSFESISAVNAYVYHTVQAELIERFKRICAELESRKSFFGLEVDVASSSNDAGLYRLPNTFNTKTGTTSKILFTKEVRKYQFWGENGLSSICRDGGFLPPCPEKQRKAKPVIWRHKTESAVCSAIERLILLRGYRNHPAEGMRDLLCYVYFNAALQSFGADAAYEMTKKLNMGLCDPFSEKELMLHIKHIARKVTIHRFTGKKIPGYLHTNRYIISVLGITKEEQAQIGFCPAEKRMAETEKKLPKTKKDKRQEIRAGRVQDRNRARMLHQKYPQMSMRAIAKICGYTRQWATKYCETAFEEDWQEATYTEGRIDKTTKIENSVNTGAETILMGIPHTIVNDGVEKYTLHRTKGGTGESVGGKCKTIACTI